MPWVSPIIGSEILAVHAALMPTGTAGQVLLFGGDEHNAGQAAPGGDFRRTRLFDIASRAIVAAFGQSGSGHSPDSDVFCGAHAFLGNGLLLVGGGTYRWPDAGDAHNHPLDFLGERRCWVFDPFARTWQEVGSLSPSPNPDIANRTNFDEQGGGRWYPTIISLGNGDVIAFFGHLKPSDPRHRNTRPERYRAAENRWQYLPNDMADPAIPPSDTVRLLYFPRCYLLPNGQLFFATPMPVLSDAAYSCTFFDPIAGSYTGAPIAAAPGYTDWFTSSALLPLLPGDDYRARVVVCGSERNYVIDLAETAPSWVETPRASSTSNDVRANGIAVLLPTGEVAMVGGVRVGAPEQPFSEPEIYNPDIDWASGTYAGTAGSWATRPEPAAQTRNYHSTALLLPDGRIWTAGGNINAQSGPPSSVGNLTIELYEPPYIGPGRPQITSAPTGLRYGQSFEISCSTPASEIQRVALMRCGSVTHAWNFDQRYVGLEVATRAGNTLTVVSPPHGDVAPPGYYMLWIVDSSGKPCEQAPFVRLTHRQCTIVTDRSTFSKDEIDALAALGSPDFSGSFYVHVEGYSPGELGIALPPADLATIAPVITFDSPVPGIVAFIEELIPEDPALPPERAQRLVFKFGLRFAGVDLSAVEAEMITIHASPPSGDAYAASGDFFIKNQPAPYMLDGDTPWLSRDLRVFARTSGGTVAGVTLGTDPAGFVRDVAAAFNANTSAPPGHPFDALSEDQEASMLHYSANSAPNTPVYNFAIARVRYRAATLPANSVRVFFRMFAWQSTGLEYNPVTTYRASAGAAPIALLGTGAGNEVVSMPFFANTRVESRAGQSGATSLVSQTDPSNVGTLTANAGQEVYRYFGAWLDFNQTTPRFPRTLPAGNLDGPYADALSLQELIGSEHQCLVAEVFFDADPTEDGRTPAESDNLAQRNLAIDYSANPEGPDAHTVMTTFDLKLSEPFSLSPPVSFLQSGVTRSDELMLRLDGIPAGSIVTVYLPTVDASVMAATSIARGGPSVVEQLDDHTVRCRAGGAAYLPLPGNPGDRIAGLLTVTLPPGITVGQKYRVVGHQLSGRHRRVEGTFELFVPVKVNAVVIERDIRRLSTLQYIFSRMSTSDRRYPLFVRMLGVLARKLTALGFPPSLVQPSPSGDGLSVPTGPVGPAGPAGPGFSDFIATTAGTGTRPTTGTQVINTYVGSGASFGGQNIVTLQTGTRSGVYCVSYSLRYRIEVGTNSFAFRVADTTSDPKGAALAAMAEHVHSQNVQPADRFHVAGWFILDLAGTNKKLTLQCREISGGSARIGYDDARLQLWRVG